MTAAAETPTKHRPRTSRLSSGLLLLTLALAPLAQSSSALAQPEVALLSEHVAVQADFQNVASGLEQALRANDVAVAERLYTLEVRTARLLEQTGSARYHDPLVRERAIADVRALLGRILRLQERVQQHTVAKLDRVLPGEPPQDAWARSGQDLYRPLFRETTPDPNRPAEPRDVVMNRMFEQFRASGGTDADFSYLGPRSLDGLDGAVLAEWAQFGRDRVRITTSGAKHPVIGLGRSVRGAGSLRVYRNRDGEILAVVVSNSSGNYKPGPGSTEGVVARLRTAGVPESHILVTSVIPEEPALVKLLLKADGRLSREQIAARVTGLQQTANQASVRVIVRASSPTVIHGLNRSAPERLVVGRPHDIPPAPPRTNPRARLPRPGGPQQWKR